MKVLKIFLKLKAGEIWHDELFRLMLGIIAFMVIVISAFMFLPKAIITVFNIICCCLGIIFVLAVVGALGYSFMIWIIDNWKMAKDIVNKEKQKEEYNA